MDNIWILVSWSAFSPLIVRIEVGKGEGPIICQTTRIDSLGLSGTWLGFGVTG